MTRERRDLILGAVALVLCALVFLWLLPVLAMPAGVP